MAPASRATWPIPRPLGLDSGCGTDAQYAFYLYSERAHGTHADHPEVVGVRQNYAFPDRSTLSTALINLCGNAGVTLGVYGPLRYWDVSQVDNFDDLFNGLPCASSHYQDITHWDVSQVTSMARTFRYSGGPRPRPTTSARGTRAR